MYQHSLLRNRKMHMCTYMLHACYIQDTTKSGCAASYSAKGIRKKAEDELRQQEDKHVLSRGMKMYTSQHKAVGYIMKS